MKTNRYRWLGVLQAFIGIGAVVGGLMLILDPSGKSLGTPIELLENTPFKSFLVPGIVLFIVNGLGSIAGSIASFVRHKLAGAIALALGAFLVMWIVVQVYWMEPHWLHGFYFVLGLLEVSLGWSLQKSQQSSSGKAT